MATQTAVYENSTLPDQQVKEEVQDEVRQVEEKPSESLASEEVKKADVVEPSPNEEPKITNEEPIPAAPLAEAEDKIIEPPVTDEAKLVAEDLPAPLAEPEEVIEDKNIEPPVIEEPKITDEEAKPVDDNVPNPAAPLAETNEDIEYKNIDPPAIEEPKTDKEAKTEAALAKDSVEIKEAQVDLPVQESEPAKAEEEIPMSFPALEEKTKEQFEEEVTVVDPKESVNLGTLLKEDASIKEEPIIIETLVEVPKGDKYEEKSTLTDPIFAPEAAEKSLDLESISRDVELVAESEKEVIKEQILAAAETDGDELVTKESVEKEPKKTEGEEKGEEAFLTEESKITEDLPKEEVKSKSLLSKVKSSLVKAKKAIIGKSPNPKATETPPDTKSEVKV